jgi:uncharacterized protein (DUF58 family)
MSVLGRWFGLGLNTSASVAAPTPPANAALLNSATCVTVDDLVALQTHAGSIDLTYADTATARLLGGHLSRFRGRGMDYQESRVYQAGDDVRSIDWRVTARTGKAHTKLFQEERERPVMLVLDLNPGMFFGSRGALKSVVAARASTLLAWSAAAHGDRIGALLFNGGHWDLQARSGKHGVLRFIREIVRRTDPRIGVAGGTDAGGLNAALIRLRRVSRPGSLIVLFSDFYGIDDDSSKHLLRLRQHSDVAAMQIVDPLEETSPTAARYGVIAGDAPGILDTRSAAARAAYRDYFARHHQTVAAIMRSRAIPLLRLSTQDNVVEALRRHFAAGRGRSSQGALAA